VDLTLLSITAKKRQFKEAKQSRVASEADCEPGSHHPCFISELRAAG